MRTLLQFRRGNTVVDINRKDCYGNTPLYVAAHYNCPAAAAALIEHGADLNTVDDSEESPIFTAIYENAHEIITQLLQAGCDYTIKTKSRNTVLHCAANDSDAQTIALLTKARLCGIDVEARNEEGLTALDLASARVTGITEEWKILFERLVDSITDPGYDSRSMASITSGGESWKSFEDTTWEEAEWAASEDVKDGDIEDSETVEPAPTPLPIHDLRDEKVMVQDMAYK